MLAPTEIMQSVFWRKSQLPPEPICDQAIEARTFIHLVEMGQRFAGEQSPAIHQGLHRRSIPVVQQSLDQIACGCKVLEPLLVLDPDGRTTKFISKAYRRNVHLALL